MFLSKVWIGWQWARDPYQQHRALWQLFPDRPDSQRDFLFRVEDRQPGRGATVLLQSAQRPEKAPVARVLATKAMPEALPDSARLRFCLRANPVKTIRDEQRLDRRGQPKRVRVPLIREEDQLNWLNRKLTGAAVLEAAQVMTEQPLYFRKDSMHGKIQPVRFEGLLTVADPQSLLALLSQGIGPGKAMGCGLLSLAAG